MHVQLRPTTKFEMNLAEKPTKWVDVVLTKSTAAPNWIMSPNNDQPTVS